MKDTLGFVAVAALYGIGFKIFFFTNSSLRTQANGWSDRLGKPVTQHPPLLHKILAKIMGALMMFGSGSVAYFMVQHWLKP